MAAITRRGLDEIRTEVINRLGKSDADATLLARIEHLIYAAYLSLATTFHHPELEIFDATGTLSTSNNLFVLPVDTYVVMSVKLRQPTTSVFAGRLTRADSRFVFQAYDDEEGLPTRYTRIASGAGGRLYLDKKPDVAYEVDLLYYQRPAAPDFATDSTAFDWTWDEYLIQYTLALGWPTVWRFDWAQIQQQTLAEYLARTIHPPIKGMPLLDLRGQALEGRDTGGTQG